MRISEFDSILRKSKTSRILDLPLIQLRVLLTYLARIDIKEANKDLVHFIKDKMTPDEVNQAPIINSKDLNIYNKNSDSEDEDIPKFQFSLFKKRDLHPNVRNFIPPPKIPSSKNIRKKDSTFLNFDPDCLVAKLKSSISINHSCSKGIPFITKRPKTHSNLFR